jgi:alginate O-acetyltransferase complex protein AlgI
MLTALWHGANWNFVLWGMFLYLLILVERCGLKKYLDRFPVLGHLYMFFMIPISWLFFAVSDLPQIRIYLCRMFPFFGQMGQNVYAGDFLKYGSGCIWPLAAALLCCTGIPRKLYDAKKYTIVVTLALVVLFWGCIYSVYLGLDDPFLYYQF